jgi:SAM-dependent methyltransferase
LRERRGRGYGRAMSTTAPDAELKARHRKMWASGDYPSMVEMWLTPLGPRLVGALDLAPGMRVLDVAAGTGNAAIPAAQAGADVTASDLTPELLEAGRQRAEAEGIDLAWRQADAESLPFDDSEFDDVLSAIGVMFAPHHRRSADELVRVCRPGGSIALASWTPEGFIGRMFATMKPFAPPPPPGAQPPPLWGDEQHVRDLLGDRVAEVTAVRRTVRVDAFDHPAHFRDYFKAAYGPTIVAYRNLGDDAERVAELDAALEDLAERSDQGDGDFAMEWEYLLLTARRAA